MIFSRLSTKITVRKQKIGGSFLLKKRAVLFFISLILLLGGIGPSPIPAAASGSVTITADNINVREGPGLSYKVAARVHKGNTYPLLKEQADWIKIDLLNGQTGWVANWLVSKNQAASSSSKISKGKITVNSLNVRSAPSLQSTIIGKLQKGEAVTVLSQKGEWTEISYSGKSAWISSEYVLVEKKVSKKNSTPKVSSNLSGVIGTVTATTLSVRDEGNLNGNIIGAVSKGEKFQIYEEVNNWAKIEWKPGKFGWVANWFLDKTESSSNKPVGQSVKNSTVTILHNGTNLRKGPSIHSEVIQRANQGETFEVVRLQNDWYEIRLQNGETAFVAGWIVHVKGSAPQVEKPGVKMNLKNKTIVLDPGHGGRDHGTTGTKGTLEKQVTLRTANLLYDKLKSSGANVILTRKDDTYIPLSSRTGIAKYHNADAFISIHYDSNSNHSVRGITSYYYHAFQKPLAESVHSATIKKTKMKDRGVRFGDYYVIRETNKNAILLELGYLSNPTEEIFVTSDQYQESVSSGIFQGLASYFNQ
jgi:N-acetylmuramoyl-L-alanine amidase